MVTRTPEKEIVDLTQQVAQTAIVDVIPARGDGWETAPWFKLRGDDYGDDTDELEHAIQCSTLRNPLEIAEGALSTKIEEILIRSIAASEYEVAKVELQRALDEFQNGKPCLVFLNTKVPQPGGQIIPPRWRGIPLDLRKPQNPSISTSEVKM